MLQPIMIDETIRLYEGDCLKVLPLLATEGIKADLILADLPYGTTHCKWDSVIDYAQMWETIGRIINPNTPILLFAQQPFTIGLLQSEKSTLQLGMGKDSRHWILECKTNASQMS